jgi:thiol-disulfide isomerase/thioredoxin
VSARSRTPLIIAVVIVVVAAAAIAAVLATRGGGNDDNAGSSTGSTIGGFGTVTVEGAPLDPPPDSGTDPDIGKAVPTVSGTNYQGTPVAIEPGKHGPMMIVVMAHWCPHCNREIPLLVDWKKSGKVPDGLEVVGVSTAASSQAPNYPPAEWIQKIGWDWPVIADDEQQTAAVALGTPGYPYLLFVDADGNMLARTSGEQPIEQVQQLADAAAKTAS